MKSRFTYAIIGFCLMFLCMLVGGIVLICIPVQMQYPQYFMNSQNDLDYWYESDYLYINTGIGVFMTIIGFFGFMISCCFACAIRPEKTSDKLYNEEQEHLPQFAVQQNYPQFKPMPTIQDQMM
ncbi:Hypothetical_protein [Hexamita inflata]|uniref:Hypothetical_protein n=1 Tax=Hexamita inflata TaxID=28002 RepID=A0AA86NF48_9EUKA|nr:Hypothetical protein HINF_LOCUS5571 [Hexamita inflata]